MSVFFCRTAASACAQPSDRSPLAWGFAENPSPSTFPHLLLPLISQGVGAVLRHLLQLSDLLVFAFVDDLGFPQQNLNCGRTGRCT